MSGFSEMVESRQQATINVAYAIKTRPCVKLRDATLISQASLVTFDTVMTGPSFAVLVVGVALIRSPLSFRQSSKPTQVLVGHSTGSIYLDRHLHSFVFRLVSPNREAPSLPLKAEPHFTTHIFIDFHAEVSACYNRDRPQQHSNDLLSLVVRPASSRSYFS
jgi:hypothetical protein